MPHAGDTVEGDDDQKAGFHSLSPDGKNLTDTFLRVEIGGTGLPSRYNSRKTALCGDFHHLPGTTHAGCQIHRAARRSGEIQEAAKGIAAAVGDGAGGRDDAKAGGRRRLSLGRTPHMGRTVLTMKIELLITQLWFLFSFAQWLPRRKATIIFSGYLYVYRK